jgi:hypothetical protein
MFNREWAKDCVLKKMKKKKGVRWTKKNGNKFRSLSFEQ